MALPPSAPAATSADPGEIARFEALARDWWDETGKFRPLHRLNPTRVKFVLERACRHYGRDPASPRPLTGLTLLDIGCGGGLLAEPMAKAGASVAGIDPGRNNIEAARRHAAMGGLTIDYRCGLAEELVAENARFDVVLALEVVEHVADVGVFLSAACGLVAPGGIVIVATLNRTLKSYALAIVGAEYVLGWLPKGTHDWRKFLRPSELAASLARCGVQLMELTGVAYNPVGDRWRLSNNLDVNYMALAAKPPA
jgi:2-polyprenyl-6-hydroxyphenyl methylase/3-demethylubiquinone-9 3-methyltransferase